ncbi:MAG: NADH-quinone oxidoreductase subunit M, partial [Gammaproteobacteria bacterium]|nr:NADH-quinone oxidoreductase subunit M [Gammaproteobacteria bacterium]
VLTTMIAVPVAGSAVALLTRTARQAAIAGRIWAVLELGLVVFLLLRFDRSSDALQFVEHGRLLAIFSYRLGIDGISLPFVLLAALLPLLLVLYEEIVHERPPGLYVALILAGQAALMGLLLSLNLLQFWLLACLELVPPLLILRHWSTGEDKRGPARLYGRFQAGGLLMLLLGVFLLGWNHARLAGHWSFDYVDLLRVPIADSWQAYILVLLFYGLAVRLAQFPFHGWLPPVAQHGTLATVPVLVVGIKIGIYGLMRFVLPMLPGAVLDWQNFVVGLGVAGMFYGAVLALMQLGLRRLLAFSAISQTGMLVVGVFTLDREGLTGSLLLSVNFGMAASGLLFATGLVHRRAGSTLLPRLGGMFEAMPLLGITFLIAALSTMAMPGTPGFDAAHLLLDGAIGASDWGIATAVAIGNVLTAAFLLWAFQRIFLAERRAGRPSRPGIPLTRPEWLLASTVCLTLLAVGFHTGPWVAIVAKSVGTLTSVYIPPTHRPVP